MFHTRSLQRLSSCKAFLSGNTICAADKTVRTRLSTRVQERVSSVGLLAEAEPPQLKRPHHIWSGGGVFQVLTRIVAIWCFLWRRRGYEWRRDTNKSKTPFFIRLKAERPFFIAGIYEDESPPFPAGYVLLTTGPNELMRPIHDRMPVILTAETVGAWLTRGDITPERVHEVCQSYLAVGMIADPVSTIVNNARNDVPECVVTVN